MVERYNSSRASRGWPWVGRARLITEKRPPTRAKPSSETLDYSPTGSAPTTGLAAASTWRLTCPLASAALFGPRPAAPIGPRPPRLPCASRSVALLHPPLSGSSTPGRRAGSAWAPALGSHCELRGHGCLRAECVRLPDGRRARPHLVVQGRTTVPLSPVCMVVSSSVRLSACARSCLYSYSYWQLPGGGAETFLSLY